MPDDAKLVDDDGVEHYPTPALDRTTADDAPDPLSCGGCGYRWPCPYKRQQPEPLLEGGELVADLVDVGWSVWKRLPAGADYVPPGGVVVEVEHADDPSAPPRRVRVLEWHGGRPEFLDFGPGEYDPLLSNPPNSRAIRGQARRIATLVGRGKGSVTPFEYDLLRVAVTLLGTVA